MRPGVVGDARGDVHGAPEEVALLRDHGAGVDPDPRRHRHRALGLLDEVEPAEDRPARVGEVEHDAVTEPLDRATAVRVRSVLPTVASPAARSAAARSPRSSASAV